MLHLYALFNFIQILAPEGGNGDAGALRKAKTSSGIGRIKAGTFET